MKALAGLILAAALAQACAHGPRPIVLGPADGGKSIQMAVRQIATIRLASNPSTGYSWQTITEPDARVVIIEDSGYDRPVASAPGTPGQAWWKLRATGAGETTIEFVYARPWEKPAEDAQKFTLTITVK